MSRNFTTEQLEAIERRSGDLLLDASAGAGKTSVLVERFAQAVIQDGIAVSAILAITFTEKAAAELRDRIRLRLRELGADEAARATEGAFISTIHGFCARVLRANALAAGIDPAFTVLDESQSVRLAGEAFEAALEHLAESTPGGVELIAAYTAWQLRSVILSTHAELRSRGESSPTMPPLPPAPDLAQARADLEHAAGAAAAELGRVDEPSAKVRTALERLEHCSELITVAEPWPADLGAVALPGGNGRALSTAACEAYSQALTSFRSALESRLAGTTIGLLDELLRSFATRYAERKRACSGLDFADLELMTRDLLADGAELRGRYHRRFEQIMVDELQDTNPVQLELIESVARENLFTVGDALQSIYGFRHADVELFERRRGLLAARGEHATLNTNFRSRREILDAVNVAFTGALGDRFRPLRTGRDDTPAPDARVELLVADKGADWEDVVAAPWRIAEAAALAERVRRLIDEGAAPGEIVLLTRATTDLRIYERALEDRAIPTYVIGGRGYWSHPQVVDMLGYLRALMNPRDEEALYTVLASPLVGVSPDTLVVLAAAARRARRDPWWMLRDPGEHPFADELEPGDRGRLASFTEWFEAERRASPHLGVEDLIERALELTGYDLAMLALPGGERRLANVRKLMRLGREHEADGGGDLRGFLDLVGARHGPGGVDSRESEAPVEGEALDAVRLMTIHRAKGLEFPIVCVADLGRQPWSGAPLLRIGRDGRIGLRLSRPGTGKAAPVLDYEELADEARQNDEREERRLFYVAMTRAQERLILSGAAKLDPWPTNGAPMWWIGSAFLGELATTLTAGDEGVAVRALGEWSVNVAYAAVGPEANDASESGAAAVATETTSVEAVAAQVEPPAPVPEPAVPVAEAAAAPPVAQLSYSSLGEYSRCGYRFYLERVLGLPRGREPRREQRRAGGRGGLTGAERGVLVHALLEGIDFGRPIRPPASAVATAAAQAGLAPSPDETDELQNLVERFGASALCARIAAASDVRREEPFRFVLQTGGVSVTGILDVAAREGDRLLVVDYKSDRLEGSAPATIVQREYAMQRLVYALAALTTEVAEVEVVHVFLEQPEQPVSAVFTHADAAELGRSLSAAARGVLTWDFGVSDAPCRVVCAGCPGEGGLCSWPLDMTRRDATDRLF
jgi:ATP-dependent helicase/nuclease subunit A